mgnify:CR=1 FL=1
MIGVNEVAISILVLLNTFIIYKVYNISVKIARIEERVEWLIKIMNNK